MKLIYSKRYHRSRDIDRKLIMALMADIHALEKNNQKLVSQLTQAEQERMVLAQKIDDMQIEMQNFWKEDIADVKKQEQINEIHTKLYNLENQEIHTKDNLLEQLKGIIKIEETLRQYVTEKAELIDKQLKKVKTDVEQCIDDSEQEIHNKLAEVDATLNTLKQQREEDTQQFYRLFSEINAIQAEESHTLMRFQNSLQAQIIAQNQQLKRNAEELIQQVNKNQKEFKSQYEDTNAILIEQIKQVQSVQPHEKEVNLLFLNKKISRNKAIVVAVIFFFICLEFHSVVNSLIATRFDDKIYLSSPLWEFISLLGFSFAGYVGGLGIVRWVKDIIGIDIL
ncbi:MAG: hypothetical protein GY795_28150 [Desulfobacterales bacterium]|nr:hypothetical protein [Desulfobacterales bacterium]